MYVCMYVYIYIYMLIYIYTKQLDTVPVDLGLVSQSLQHCHDDICHTQRDCLQRDVVWICPNMGSILYIPFSDKPIATHKK